MSVARAPMSLHCRRLLRISICRFAVPLLAAATAGCHTSAAAGPLPAPAPCTDDPSTICSAAAGDRRREQRARPAVRARRRARGGRRRPHRTHVGLRGERTHERRVDRPRPLPHRARDRSARGWLLERRGSPPRHAASGDPSRRRRRPRHGGRSAIVPTLARITDGQRHLPRRARVPARRRRLRRHPPRSRRLCRVRSAGQSAAGVPRGCRRRAKSTPLDAARAPRA